MKQRRKDGQKISLLVTLHAALSPISIHIMSAVGISIAVKRKPELLAVGGPRIQRRPHTRDDSCGTPIGRGEIRVIEVLKLRVFGSLLLEFGNACSLWDC